MLGYSPPDPFSIRLLHSEKLSRPLSVARRPQLKGIQSLRGVAAILVIFLHLFYWLSQNFETMPEQPAWTCFGECGVDLFFVISGFIILYVTPAPFVSCGDQARFLIRRFARIYPTYWAISLPLFLLVLWKPAGFPLVKHHDQLFSSLFLLPQVNFPLLVVAWTLTFELYFYFMASFIFYWGRRARIVAFIAWFIAVIGANLLHLDASPNPWLHLVFSPFSAEFILGTFVAGFLLTGSVSLKGSHALRVVGIALLIIFLAGTVHARWRSLSFLTTDTHLRILVYGVPSVVIVWAVLQMEFQGQWNYIKSIAFLGDRSYSIYLLHVPIFAFVFKIAAGQHLNRTLFQTCFFVFVALAGLAASVELSYRYIEVPAQALGKRLAPHKIRPPTA